MSILEGVNFALGQHVVRPRGRQVDDHHSRWDQHADPLTTAAAGAVASTIRFFDDPPEQPVLVVLDRRRDGLLDPVSGHDLLAVPDSALSVELPDLQHVRRRQPQTEPADLDALRVGPPTESGLAELGREEVGQRLGERLAGGDAQRIEELLPGVVENRAGLVAIRPFQRGREHRRHQVGAGIGVPESRPRRVLRTLQQQIDISLRPASPASPSSSGRPVVVETARHGHQLAQSGLGGRVTHGMPVVGQQLAQWLVEADDEAVGDRDPDQDG